MFCYAGAGPVTLAERSELLHEAEHEFVCEGFHLFLRMLPC
jgi:hypothetical protein